MSNQNPDFNIVKHDPATVPQHGNAFQEHECPKTPEAEKVIEVEIATNDRVLLDGVPVKKGEIVKISVKQWRALSRHFRWKSGPDEHCPAYALPIE